MEESEKKQYCSVRRGYYSEIITGTEEYPVKPKVNLLPTALRRTKLTWQIFTEHHASKIKDLQYQKARNFLGAAERWMTFAEDRSIVFPAESFAPKVQMELHVEAKCLPRNVEMERRRRLYRSHKLENVLEKEGVSPRDMLPPRVILSYLTDEEVYGLYNDANCLPLEIFDDEEFDCRTSDDWMNLGLIEGIRHPLPATVFVEKNEKDQKQQDSDMKSFLNDLFGWYLAAVVDYNKDTRLWTIITLDGYKRTFLLPRIYIRFFAEDPRIFARRVASAIKNRQIAENSNRYNFYLDCMQMEGMPTLSHEEKTIISIYCTRQGALKCTTEKLASLIDEIEYDYQRTMCDLMCRKLIEQRSDVYTFIYLEPIEESAIVPKKGKIDTDMQNFQETVEYIRWYTLYVLTEVYDAMRCVVVECINVSSMNLFVSNYGKSMILSEFESQQNQATTMVIKYLKEPWLEKITQSVRMCLRDVGKGWFNLEQKFAEVYNVMKLKRLMNLILFHMQNALRNLVENSIALYLETLESPGLCVLGVQDDFLWGDNLVDTQFDPLGFPIFDIELMMNNEGAYYSTQLESFEELIISIFDNSIALCHQIRQVHPLLLPNLRFSQDLFLSSVGLLDKKVCEVRERVTAVYKKSVIPLKAYAKEYNKYLALYVLDIVQYVNGFRSDEYTAIEIKDEISFQRRMMENLAVTLPKNIVIGAFNVNVHPLRNFLLLKREAIATQLLVVFTERLRIQVDEVLQQYVQIRIRLSEDSRNVEHLFEQKEWVDTIPVIVQKIDESMQKTKIEFDILEYFRWNLSDADFEAKWEAIAFPYRMKYLIAEAKERFIEEEEKFLKLQVQDEVILLEKIDTLVGNVMNVGLQTDVTKVHEVAIDVKRIWKVMKECQSTGLKLNERQKLLGMDVVPFEHLTKLMKEFEPYKTMWVMASDWLKLYEIWMENSLMTVDASDIHNEVNEMYKTMSRSVRTFEERPKVAAVAQHIKDQIDAFKPYVAMIQALRKPGIKARHFDELSALTGIQMELTPTLTFKDLIVLGIMQFEDTVTKVADEAEKEYSIEGTLDRMIEAWEGVTMDVIPYKDTESYIMKISDENMLMLDDHILSAQQISFSPFKVAFEERFDEWEHKLKLSQEVILLWIEVQKRWMYLEPIFTTEDISRQLPVETRKFKTMNRNWNRIMNTAYECPYIMQICPDESILDNLKDCIFLLDVVQKGLTDYLETKRMLFPRFYFLSDDELLDIVAQTKNVQAVQPHLKKCFENMKELKFEDDLLITKMYSSEYEEVVLRPPQYPEGGVENWLSLVEFSMRNTLKLTIGDALESVKETAREKWVYMWPGQVILCVGQIQWTANVENGIRNNNLGDYQRTMLMELDNLRELIRGPQTEVQRLMLESVIVIEVHARDVLDKLVKKAIASSNNFEWISQLRYYWIDEDVKLRMVNAEFPYSYEYLGNNGRLVITPLTDRCYLTLTGALHLKFGGAPAGPAGTGKTETTKDLAKAFAIQCVVFNCSDQLDYLSMGKFFTGLASAGAWACFDEFNRIDIEVLSVIAQQITTIQKAQQISAEIFVFEGAEISLKSSCAVFITMNPGYAGRTELPDNLKALFRPVAMMVPNYALIAEISLFSYGFSEAKVLAAKITTTFKLSSEQLSTQDHYDFGMRAVKAVIAMAGNLKREQQHLDEPQICLRALRDVNVPKFLKDDLKLFNGIVSDLFPQLVEIPADYGILEAEIRKTTREKHLEDVDEFVKKVIQLYETTVVRHGLMLIGPTGSGKTKCYEVLRDACTKLKKQLQPNGKPFTPVLTYVLNPKAVTMGQLYGEYDLDTHEWTDGVLSTLIRAGTAVTDDKKRWYIFDGPVDAIWVENLNTVLDDNKKLCLISGEIMQLMPTQIMMFEVADLKVASPATVSRCGMVYLEPEGLGSEAFINGWIDSLPKTMTDYAENMKQQALSLVLPAMEFLREQITEIVSTSNAGVLQAFINLMNYRIGPMAGRDNKPPPNYTFQKTIPTLLPSWTAFAVVWSLGATCDYKGRSTFSTWLKKQQKILNHSLPFPEEGLVYDYRLHDGGFSDPIEGQDPIPPQWFKWSDDIPPVQIKAQTGYADMEVPTVDYFRHGELIGYLLINESNVLCVGPTGSGKTSAISAKLYRNLPKKYICDFIIFSARTSANQVQDLVDTKLEKRRKAVYGPPIMKHQVFFIDDLNMPAMEKFGAQPPIELLRQFMDFKGWYDRQEIGTFRLIEDVNFVGAMGPPGGGRNPITDRLLRHFHFIAFPDMEDDVKRGIFKVILNSWLSRTTHFANLLDPLTNATIQVFNTICKQLLPTPNKSHYTFNLRDLSKAFQGVLMADPTKIDTHNKLFLLWYHENLRVYSDRLVNDADRQCFDKLLRDILTEQFNCNTNTLIGNKTLYYGDFCGIIGQYEEITNAKKMKKVLSDYLEEYNSTSTSPMTIVLFQYAMQHICRIVRILRQPRGNGLLLGMGGSGRRSLTKLASYIQEYECFQIEATKAYTQNDWREDIKSMMMKAGLQQQPSVFLFSDTQIKSAYMLEDLNNVLNSGDVPNIYTSEETERIFYAMRGVVQEAALAISRSNLFSAYLKIVMNNLHTIVTMSPIGETFRARIRQFPALVNCCTIDWFSPWPDAALQAVATHFLSNIKDQSINENILKLIVKMCQFMHSSVTKASERFFKELCRHNYVTPTSYLQLLSSYGILLTKKKNELNVGINRLTTGLSKLANTEAEVKEMQRALKRLKPTLEKAAIATAKMIEQISRDKVEAEKTRVEAMKQEQAAAKLKGESKAMRDDAEADLSEVKPMLDAAEESLKALNKSDITEVKAMKRPPVGVLLVIEAMCIVNNISPNKLPGSLPGEKILDYWTPGVQMLADPGHFLQMMTNFNKDNITQEMITKLQSYMENPRFQPEKILKVSKACHSLCLWIHAMYNYYFVNLKVKPKMEVLAKADAALEETNKILAAAMEKLQEVEDSVKRLEDNLEAEQKKMEELGIEKTVCEERMGRAVKLIGSLANEQQRWVQTTSEMKISLRNVVGDILLCSGAVAYLTPFTDTYRQDLLTSWREILGEGVPHTPGCTPVSTLGDQVKIRRWQLDGLPRDLISVENAVLVMHSQRWPLFIDPQRQANKWIRNTWKSDGLAITKTTDKDLMRVLESCIRFGKACLIENVDTELETSLNPILMKSLFKHGGNLSIKVGDTVVPYHQEFRLYLTTMISNPHYSPEDSVKVMIVNFALTSSGLLDQMMCLVTIQERPDLEEIRNSLIISNAEMKKELKELEDRILHRLSVSEGSAVDDIDLILTLDASKEKSEEIKVKVQVAEETQSDIDSTRSLYIPVADRAQLLFFCLYNLQNIERMYQYSLEWFFSIFNNSILATEKTPDIETRVASINKNFTFDLFSNVCHSLFARHKLHFAFFICLGIELSEGLIDLEEWKHFIIAPMPTQDLPNPAPQWISPRCWREIQALELLPKFEGFVKSFQQLLPDFKAIFDTKESHLTPFPDPWNEALNDFEKMMVLKCIRPDKVINSIQIYIAEHLGKNFVEPQSTDISMLYQNSTNQTPLVFILSAGTDPAADLYKFAAKQKMSKRLFSISLGQGQGPRAEAMLRQSSEFGYWAFFQNCHLAPSWMPQLENAMEILAKETHRDFRLWLTSTPSPHFPVTILQNSYKMAMEQPKGIKANMLGAYLTQVAELEEFLQSEDSKVVPFKFLIFSLCLFHSVLLERRKFGSLGFNIPYEFTTGDLTICISQLRMFLMEYDKIPYKILIYTAGNINYGGRITDDWDRRCVLTILEDYYNVNVVSEGHRFDKAGIYYQLPKDATFQDYVDYIKTLPLNDDPSLFGMHMNADISFAQAETYSCLNTLLALQSGEKTDAESSVENIVVNTAKEILSTLPEPFDLSVIEERYPICYEESFNTVLLQEAKRYNGLLTLLKLSLEDLLKALQGLVVMAEHLEKMTIDLSNNKVPEAWQKIGFASLKPLGSWFIELQERIEFMNNWYQNGIPVAFWFSGFYFPQAFLTATLQNFVRKQLVSIDVIDFSFQVLSTIPEVRPNNGCVVYGLFLEGCRWGGDYLVESNPKELYTEMPPIFLLPEKNHRVRMNEIYLCPVYKTLTRAGTLSTTGHSTNFVLAMELPSQNTQAHWIKQGVALICSLDY